MPSDGSKLWGSPGYTAPDILRDEGYTTNADLFSVFSILFNLLTSEPLFNGEKGNDIFLKNKECDISEI
jgi:calcium/calmodulin-dependent protein kinase I